MSDTNAETNVAADRLRSFVDRILRLKEEQDSIGADVKDVYAEAKGEGYDKTALGSLVSDLRKRAKNSGKVDEQDALMALYWNAYHGKAEIGTDRARAHTHEAWQAPRQASLSEQKEAFRAGQPISQDFAFENASIYFAEFPAVGLLKIGVSNDVSSRVVQLAKEQNCSGRLLASFKGNRQVEMEMHRQFSAWLVEGEWFTLCPQTVELAHEMAATHAHEREAA